MCPNMSGKYPSSMTPPKAAPRSMPIWRLRTMVSPEARNSSMRMYHGPMLTRPAAARRPEPFLGFWPNLEVVVDHRHLPVEHEVGVTGVMLEKRDQRVDQLNERQPEYLVGLVPFPVPVRVRNDGSAAGGHDRHTMRWRRWP